jgi:hypothetical protein
MKSIKAVNHGLGKIDLKEIQKTSLLVELVPVELHHKEDGDLDDKPSFCIVLKSQPGMHFYGQISLRMLDEAMNQLGYSITNHNK